MFIRTIDSISMFMARVTAATAIIMLGLVFSGVVARYVFNSPLLFSDEIAAYLLVFHSFIGAAGITMLDRNLRTTVLVQRFPAKVRLWLDFITWILGFIIMHWVLYETIMWTYRAYDRGFQAQSIMLTPMWIPYLSIPVGFALLSPQCGIQVYRAYQALRSGMERGPLAGQEVSHAGS